jgi:undecaprenyl pyrophosphate synthase
MHLGIIPDGNRRYCKSHSIDPSRLVDVWVTRVVSPALMWLLRLSVSPESEPARSFLSVTEVSLYVLSGDNMRRGDDTVALVSELVETLDAGLRSFMAGPVGEALVRALLSRVRLRVVGERDGLPPSLAAALDRWQSLCTGSRLTVNLAVNYDGERDCSGGYPARERTPIDLVFRSGGEKRLSGFFPAQTLYSELYFSDSLWPEVGAEEMARAISWFRARQRRFGR